MKSAWDLTLETIQIMSKMDDIMDWKSTDNSEWLDTELNRLEYKLCEIKSKLRKININ